MQIAGQPPCVVCRGDIGLAPDCAECAGTGQMWSVPYCERGWDQVIPGLWVGGHDCHIKRGSDGNVVVGYEFDLVVSLYYRQGHGPPPGVRQLHHRMIDGALDPVDHGVLDDLAREVAEVVRSGQDALVRCQAGLNRSSLVAALAMIKMGWSADEAIAQIREARSPYALCNPSFVAYLRGVAA